MPNQSQQEQRPLGSSESLLTERQAAAFLALSASLLQKWRLRGAGPSYHKIGRAVRYKHSDLESFAQSSRISRTPSSTHRFPENKHSENS